MGCILMYVRGRATGHLITTPSSALTLQEEPTVGIVRYEYDPSADALYMPLRPGHTCRTLELGPSVFLDVDQQGWVLGIEVINPDPELLDRLRSITGPFKVRPRSSL
jgi:uncharacterized protein YuzE